MTTKDELLELIDGLDEDAVGALLDYGRWLASDTDDEPLSDDVGARVREGRDAIARGDYVTLAELHQRLDE